MIDVDMSQAMYRFARGIEVNDETLCVDLINDLEFCEHGTYIESEHTFRHFRSMLWDSACFDRTYRQEAALTCAEADEQVLRKADQAWRDIVAHEEPPDTVPGLVADLDRIVRAAREELLTE